MSPALKDVLSIISKKLGVDYNSFNVNKYKSKSVRLLYHKDNEDVVDNSAPIVSISVGATRRFSITDSKKMKKGRLFKSFILKENTGFIMKSGVQERLYHKVETGRGYLHEECGVRYSLVFRLLKSHRTPPPDQEFPSVMSQTAPAMSTAPAISSPVVSPIAVSSHDVTPSAVPTADPSTAPKIPAVEHLTAPTLHCDKQADHSSCSSVLVIGSSLIKGLREKLLSSRGVNVKVHSKPGAHFSTIQKELNELMKKQTVCPTCISKVFIVAGGNDAQNCNSIHDEMQLYDSFNSLLHYVNSCFTSAAVNVLSLIPRQLADSAHLTRMMWVNNFMMNVCNSLSYCRFINIFTHFLNNSRRFINHGEMILNRKLYFSDKDMIHFSDVGSAVLAKTIIGAIYRPFPKL